MMLGLRSGLRLGLRLGCEGVAGVWESVSLRCRGRLTSQRGDHCRGPRVVTRCVLETSLGRGRRRGPLWPTQATQDRRWQAVGQGGPREQKQSQDRALCAGRCHQLTSTIARWDALARGTPCHVARGTPSVAGVAATACKTGGKIAAYAVTKQCDQLSQATGFVR